MSEKFTIFHKECGKLEEIENMSMDVVITSPPYNIRHKYPTYKDNLKSEEYIKILKNFISSSYRVLKNDGILIVDIAYYIFMEKQIWFASKFIKNECEKCGFLFDSVHPYFIKIEEDNFPMHTNFTKDYLSSKIIFDHSSLQTIFVFFKDKNMKQLKIEFSTFYLYENSNNEVFWPKSLIYDFIFNFSLKNKNLLDPFMGSGILGLQCLSRGCNFWAYEVEGEYIQNFLRSRNEF